MKITYDYAEGQLYRLQEDRPDGEAYTLAEAPTEFLLAALRWNDPNGDYCDYSPDCDGALTRDDMVELVRIQFETDDGVQS